MANLDQIKSTHSWLHENIYDKNGIHQCIEDKITCQEDLDQCIQQKKKYQDALKMNEHECIAEKYICTRELDTCKRRLRKESDKKQLHGVHEAGKETFIIQGTSSQPMNWEEYGFKISVSEETLQVNDTEVSVVALAGGHYKFPDNTKLVSAVYSISVSKPLLKPLRVYIQHCVNLTTSPSQSNYLQFAIAPVSTSPTYQFSIIKGGRFATDSSYGIIDRQTFSLLSILFDYTHLDDSKEKVNSLIDYSIMFYYTMNNRVSFTATKNLSALIKYVDNQVLDEGEKVQTYFRFKKDSDHVELIFDHDLSKYVFQRWIIKPEVRPCHLKRHIIDNFGYDFNYLLPPTCSVLVLPTDDNPVPVLSYDICVEGTESSLTLTINKILKKVLSGLIKINSPDTTGSHASCKLYETTGKTSLTKKDLNQIQSALKEAGLSSSDWYNLGLKLGLNVGTLNAIKSDSSNVNECLSNCLQKWLEKADDVQETTWSTLADALKGINNNSAADFIRKL